MTDQIAKYLSVLPDLQSKEMFREVVDKMLSAHIGMTEFQITMFVLNEVEFPTPYGRWRQARFELVNRYDQLVELYYDIRETELEIELKSSQSVPKAETALHLLRTDRMRSKLESLKRRLKTMAREAEVFFMAYAAHAEFANMTAAQLSVRERAEWVAKAEKNPTAFEERYGDDFMRTVLGDRYQPYVEARRRAVGILPREMISDKGKARES